MPSSSSSLLCMEVDMKVSEILESLEGEWIDDKDEAISKLWLEV